MGKVPSEILETIVFKHLGTKREDVVLGPRKGEDAAIVKANNELLVLSCDPVSGAVREAGWVSVHISCNDIATRGVKPRWFQSCIMLPAKTSRKTIKRICTQMGKAAKELNISIVGGHCEFTPNLIHPLIVGFALGITNRGKYVTSSGAKVGDKILLTKSIGIEGTAILASDRYNQITSKLGRNFVNKAAKYINRISVVKEALIAIEHNHIRAMHDPTEGGIAGGLNELADASNVGFKIFEDKLFIESETKEICSLLKINPLGLISSGALLICINAKEAKQLLNQFSKRKIQSAVIGEVLADRHVRVIVKKDGRVVPLMTPAKDELWQALTKVV